MTAESARVIRAYYDAFNAQDVDHFLDLLTEDVAHEINQGGREVGKDAFARFLAHMNRCYEERIEDLVILTNESGDRAAAEFTVHGKYLQTDSDLPPATGQTYVLPAGAFFTLRDGKVARISNYYNLRDWLAQVSG
jgi:steroid delta-isomerase-like uncharacterized protein